MHIQFVSIPVADQSRAKAFYVDVLGWTCDADEESAPGRRFVDLTPSGGGAGIALVLGRDRTPPGSVQGLVLAVDDIDATYAELAARGVEFAGPVADTPYGRFAGFSDPDGNGWVLRGAAVTSS
jgi:predicted enzyme related to lactoylglutathione lyase